jgi:hypothetical protein
MRKRVSVLLASSMTVAGLAAGIIPSQAAIRAVPIIGAAWESPNFGDPFPGLTSTRSSCWGIESTLSHVARSAKNTSETHKITFYRVRDSLDRCIEPLSVLNPGEQDTGVGTELGEKGALFYSTVPLG